MHADRWVPHQGHVHPVRLRIGRLVLASVVLGEYGPVSDRLTHTQVLDVPIRITCPETHQGRTRCKRGTQEVIGIIPIPEVTPEDHGENGLDPWRHEVRGIPNAVGPGEPASTTAVAEHVALVVQGREVVQ